MKITNNDNRIIIETEDGERLYILGESGSVDVNAPSFIGSKISQFQLKSLLVRLAEWYLRRQLRKYKEPTSTEPNWATSSNLYMSSFLQANKDNMKVIHQGFCLKCKAKDNLTLNHYMFDCGNCGVKIKMDYSPVEYKSHE